MKKVLSILLVMVMLLAIGSNFAYADSVSLDPSTITGTYGDTAAGVQTIGKEILGIVQIVGSIIAVIILVVIGIKYMMGSASEKAEYKKTLMPYLIGAILIFAASNLAGVVFNWADSLGDTLHQDQQQDQQQQ